MEDKKFYYRFNGMGIDNWDEKDIKKHNKELISFDDLSEQFERLREAYETQSKERIDIMVCVWPSETSKHDGVIEISVYHCLVKKLFSKEIKKQCYALCVTKEVENETNLYFKETQDFAEVKELFYSYIVKQEGIYLSGWTVESIPY